MGDVKEEDIVCGGGGEFPTVAGDGLQTYEGMRMGVCGEIVLYGRHGGGLPQFCK